MSTHAPIHPPSCLSNLGARDPSTPAARVAIRRRALGAALGLTTMAVATLGVKAWAFPPPVINDEMPYAAILRTGDGTPATGTYGIGVRVYEGIEPNSALLYEESHGSVVVTDGELSLTVGAGTPVSGAFGLGALAAFPEASIELIVDGSVIGGRRGFGAVPRAINAAHISASGIEYGGDHGLIPAAAIEPMFKVKSEIRTTNTLYDAFVNPIDGWSCTARATIADLSPPLVGTLDELDVQDRFFAHVGPVALDLSDAEPFKNLEGLMQPLDGVETVAVTHLHTSCAANAWTANCKWTEVDDEAKVKVLVTRYCVPQ